MYKVNNEGHKKNKKALHRIMEIFNYSADENNN